MMTNNASTLLIIAVLLNNANIFICIETRLLNTDFYVSWLLDLTRESTIGADCSEAREIVRFLILDI
jgi:hypothetical protein